MIRTVEQYLESLNDGRQAWCLGEKVADVRTHPTLSSIIRTAAKRAVNIDGWQEHPIYGKLLSKDMVKMPEIDEAYKSIPVTVK